MELFVSTCVAMELKVFNSQDLAHIINGEAGWMSFKDLGVVRADGCCAGFAKLGHQPGVRFMELLVRKCVAMELQGFNPQELANTVNGEATVTKSCPADSELMTDMQALRSSAINREPGLWSCS
jgi:hypothetical protein